MYLLGKSPTQKSSAEVRCGLNTPSNTPVRFRYPTLGYVYTRESVHPTERCRCVSRRSLPILAYFLRCARTAKHSLSTPNDRQPAHQPSRPHVTVKVRAPGTGCGRPRVPKPKIISPSGGKKPYSFVTNPPPLTTVVQHRFAGARLKTLTFGLNVQYYSYKNMSPL